MNVGDTVDVTLRSGRVWNGMVASYTAETLRLSGRMCTWFEDGEDVEVMELDEDYREVLIPWRNVDYIEVWR